MKAADVVLKSLGESTFYVGEAIKGLTKTELSFRPKPYSNSIVFLMWHLARVEDFWINQQVLKEKQLYEVGGWYKKFGTTAADNGFGYDVAKLDAWPVPELSLLQAYARAVREKTAAYLKTLAARQLDAPRDFGWNKGTVGTALSHLITEVGEHSGQIGYLRGIQKGIEPPAPPPPMK